MLPLLHAAKYNISDEELRPYFALPNVLDGLFGLAQRLFDVTIEAADGAAPVWHADVRFFKLLKVRRLLACCCCCCEWTAVVFTNL